MKKMFYLVVMLSQAFITVSYSEPMESYQNYNVILVHGAGGSMYGMDCNDDSSIKEASTYLTPNGDTAKIEQENYLKLTGGYGKTLTGDRESSAKDMDKDNNGLRHWFTERIFDDDKSVAYLQRPFTNPANSPVNNARELGDRKWVGENKCSVRRSLIEEAQEVRAKGRKELDSLRKNKLYGKLPPSRNILIAHSMGGVTSREYVQGSGYNNDVDKVITLDSPHEGTGALEALLEMSNFLSRFGLTIANVSLGGEDIVNFLTKHFISKTLTNTIENGIDLYILSQFSDIATTSISLNSLLYSLKKTAIMNSINFIMGQFLITILDKHYQQDDPLVPYIDPTRSGGINDLKNRPYTDNLPMMRLLYGTNSMTFSDPKTSTIFSSKEVADVFNFILPKSYFARYYNLYSQWINGGAFSGSNDPANFVNKNTAAMFGDIFGVTIGEQGTALIPEWSGKAKDTKAFDNPNADVMRRSYDGHVNKLIDLRGVPSVISSAAFTIVTIDKALKFFIDPATLAAIKLGTSIAIINLIDNMVSATAVGVGVNDLMDSHEAPLLKEHQNNWKADANAYSKLSGERVSYEPYRMEEFLYEKPFANIRVRSSYSKDWGDQGQDTLGLYAGDSFVPVYIADKLSTLLKFKSSGDWETFGAKKVRWDVSAQGVGGNVPIRHADRYAMPGFMVEDFIQRYEFEIDDLMPHRLRQIRLNFNFNEELAWECDINKSETDANACAVYKRTPAKPDWVKIQDERHPVNKDGIFVFEPGKYYKDVGLGAIQKDNQNTVILSMVNKVGLSNSQRFYYLFKATADLVEPHWPFRNIKISRIDNFAAYASTLDYQGFAVLSGQERVIRSSENSEQAAFRDMYPPFKAGEGFLLELGGLSNYSFLGEGKYEWQVKVAAGNGSDVTESEMFIPFTIDKTPPKISLASERDFVNLDSVTFLARFKNEDSTGLDESLRMVAFFLKKDGSSIASAKFGNVLASNFGVSLSDFRAENSPNALFKVLPDGKYEIVAYAFDGSVGSLKQYDLLNSIANGDSGVSVYDIFKNGGIENGINFSKTSVEFTVDMQAPKIEEFSLSRFPSDKKTKPSYVISSDSGEFILNQDSLLKISIDIYDQNGKSTAEARYSILFSERNSGESFQMGDTVMLSKGIGQKEWQEQGGMLIPNGDYDVSIKVWDEAGNVSEAKYEKVLCIDRLPPSVEEVISTKLTYADTADDYSAKIYVEQKDNENHISEMECYWRINSGEWNKMGKKLLKKSELQNFTFEMSKEIVGANGKKHLEAGCMDWAGNFASILDLFYVGELSPIIAYPSDSIVIEGSVIAIRGTAPKRSSSDSLASYKLEWRKSGDSNWHTDGIDVGAGKRSSDSLPWLSNGVTPDIGDLGYLNLDSFDAGNYYELRLSVRDCSSCSWRSDIVSFYYWPQSGWGSGLDSLKFAVSGGEDGFIPGEDILSLSLSAAGSSGNDFRASFYAQDSKGNALFEVFADTLSISPFEGKPASFEGNGIWFWSENGTYNLQWNGLPAGEEIAIHYAGGDIDENFCGARCSLKDTLLLSNLDDVYSAAGSITIYPEMRIPKGLNKAMFLSSGSGNIQFKNTKAFWLSPRDIFKKANSADTLPVRLGKGGSMLETVVNFSGGFQVNSALYGIYYEWDGIASTGRYPQGDSVTFYAEAAENRVGGTVFRDSLKIHIKKPDLRIASDTSAQDDFYVVSYKGNNGVNGEDVALGKKSISYGIIGRDALVSAYIKNENGDIVKTFFTNMPHAASRTDKAYSISWNGVDNSEHLVSEGGHYFYISANEVDVSDPQTASLSLDFKVSYSPGVVQVKDELGVASKSSLSLLHADSLGDDYWRYSPVADYLVKAETSGKTLPDSLRNLDVDWAATGTQDVYGYSPQRFSLAVKRQREELPLVILYKVDKYMETHTDWRPITGGCRVTNRANYQYISYEKLNFSRNNLINTIKLNNLEKSGYGYGRALHLAHVEILAVPLHKWKGETELKEEDFESYKNEAVWKSSDVSDDVNGIHIPTNEENKSSMKVSASLDVGCEAKINMDEAIVCRNEDKAKGSYNPEKNLFNVTLNGNEDGKFYGSYGEIRNSYCGNKRYRQLSFDIVLEIPKTYWNAEYGYDNLVNRTIRLDQTNKTMYGSGGYLEQIANSDKLIQSAKNRIFYNGTEWLSNFNYGMLTPFEVHRFPFISVDKISSNNAFAFPDEMSDLKYQYPSYYQAKFYNQKNIFRAKIIGTRHEIGSKDTLTIDGDENANKNTSLLTHGSVEVLVSLNSALSDASEKKTIPYPAADKWKPDSCETYTSTSWLKETANEVLCKKYYDGGSKVYFAVGDFTDDEWENAMTVMVGNRRVIANINNSNNPRSPSLKFGNQSGKSSCQASLKVDSSSYDKANSRFYAKTTCDRFPNGVNAAYVPKISGVSGNDTALFSFEKDTLYIKAQNWNDSSFWRRLGAANWQDYPKEGSPQTLRIEEFFNDGWVKELELTNAKLLHLDSSQHTHFSADFSKADNSIVLSVKKLPILFAPPNL